MQAYRIVNWWRFELLKNGKLATVKTKMVSIRKSPLLYVRFPVHGHTLSADYRRMVKRAGPDFAPACNGLYKNMVELAGNQVREYRGWVLDDRQKPFETPKQLADILCLSEAVVSQALEVLTDIEVRWVLFLEFPESLHKSLSDSGLTSVPKSGDVGNNQEKKGEPFIETETEYKAKVNRFETNRSEGVRENSGEGDIADADDDVEGKKDLVSHPPASPPSASVSGTGSGSATASKQLSDTASVSVPDADSDFKAGTRGDGTSYSELLNEDDRIFQIRRDRKVATLELTQIIHPHNKSDVTTLTDIFIQLQNRMIDDCPHNLYELALNTARQCWRGDKPIAVFVAAMKKPPFHYVPKRMSVIPGKWTQEKKQ